MRRVAPFLAAAAAACAPDPPAAPPPPPAAAVEPAALTPTVELASPWRAVHARPDLVAVAVGDVAEGVRVELDGPLPGVTLVASGRTLAVEKVGERWPLVAPAFGEDLTAVSVRSEGPDLVVELVGPPLSSVVDHPEATDDPVTTWVRIRPRDGGWRIVVTGLSTIHAPGQPSQGAAGHWLVESEAWGTFDVTEPAGGRTLITLGLRDWTLDTRGFLDDFNPYPQVGMTWTRSAAP